MEKTDNIDEIIRERLKEAIANSGMSQAKLSGIAKISHHNLNRFLTGARKGITPDTIYKIAKALEIDISYLFGDADKVNKQSSIKPLHQKSFGELLQRLLDAKRMTYEDLAALDIGVGIKSISHYKNNLRVPSLSVLQNIAHALNTPVGYFFNEVSLEEALSNEKESPKSKEIQKLLDIAKDLDADSIRDLLKQAEKEKSLQDYKKITPTQKKSS
jgi:transcriptional regulator with XRE-family HTH domain